MKKGNKQRLPQKSNSKKSELPKLIEDELKSLEIEPDKLGKIREIIVRSVSVTSSYQGPVAPPSIAREWEELVPGAAERLLSLTERQSGHRIEIESTVINKQQAQSERGQYLGFVIAILFLCASVWLALAGHDTVAGILGGMDIVGLVAIFVLGKKKQVRDLADKSPPPPKEER